MLGVFFRARDTAGEMPATANEDEMSATMTDTETTEQTQSTGETQDDAFDKERAMATIAKLREYEKTAKQLEKKLREKEQADAERESDRLKDDQKWQELAEKRDAEKRELQRQLEARETQERNRLLRYEVRDAARDQGFIDPDDAYHLIDATAIEFDDNGTPQGVAKLVKALAEKKPHLIAATRTRPNGDSPLPRATDVNLTREERVAQEIEAQRRKGR